MSEEPKRYAHIKLFRESTIGAAFITKTIQLDPQTSIKFEIWDTAGQERYKSLAPMYYRNANAAILMFDLTDSQSFDKMIKWENELNLQAPENLIIKIVGNKLDLKNKPSSNLIEDAKIMDFINKNDKNLSYIETSAKTGENVDKLFETIAQDLPEELFKTQDLINGDNNGNANGGSGLVDLNSRVFNNGKSCNC
ncbi:unnamed protein product [Wickerhamomyces anomalus]